MFPNIKREKFSNHIYDDGKVNLLKQAAIYGANGSGKSNFMKAILFIRSFIMRDDFLKNLDLEHYRFQLVSEKSSVISFEIEFFHKEKYFIYSVDIDKKDISESLFLSGLGKVANKLIFERKGSTIHSNYLQNKESAKQLLELNPQSSLLSLNLKFPVLSGAELKKAYDWFSKQLEIVEIHSTIPILIALLSNQPKLLKFANDIFENVGIGINFVRIGNTPFDKWITDNKNAKTFQKIIEQNTMQPNTGLTSLKNNRNIFNVSVQNGTKTVQEFMFDQLGLEGFHKEMDITAQSDGTVRLLTLIPAVYEAMYEKKTVFIDEIDNSIHPNLVFALLQYYASNKSNGQLIFTTHTTKLLNQQELLRPDEVWLTEKSDGSTKMYSLNDFKLHNTLSLENGYLDGRYGAVPTINDFG
ncbi:transporter [Bacteroidia bacterium]|nr:transporter [Bacteroidia bacterium]